MRDPNRIPQVMEKLQKLWEQVPDWRFMQLINNIQSAEGYDLFYVEDSTFVDILDKYFNDEIEHQ